MDPTNPLLIEEIVDDILGYLNITDLLACFDVCQLWRHLVPSHALRLRPTRPPILVKADMCDPDGQAYLTSIRQHPCFKASRFSFRDTNLSSVAVKEFLQINGSDIEELELYYRGHDQQPSCPDAPEVNTVNVIPLVDLLTHKIPNLKVLSITELPPHRIPNDIFAYQSARGLPVAKIKISLCYVGNVGYSVHFLAGLFFQCPQLEELIITDWTKRMLERDDASKIISTLSSTDRLKQIKKLKIDHMNSKFFMLLSSLLVANQVRHFAIKTSVDSDGDGYPDALEQLLARQCNSLEYLQIPINRSSHVVLPPMPNLVELRISKAAPPQGPFAEDAPAVGSINYAVDFPKLRVLGLHGSFFQYVREEIYPDGIAPSQTVEVLQEIPRGVDQALMGRIGRMFPNLMIVRTPIPYEHEHLLISIWEFCPNITELFLTLDEDYTPWKSSEARERESLDSLFSGIPEPECKRLRGLLTTKDFEHEVAAFDFGELRAAMPSICNLTKLRRVCIDGPGKTLHCPGSCGRRVDKLSDMFAYSTLTELSATMQFCQLRLGLIKLSIPCVDRICHRTRLKRVVPGKPGFDPGRMRLIRPANKLEELESVPMEWYGLK